MAKSSKKTAKKPVAKKTAKKYASQRDVPKLLSKICVVLRAIDNRTAQDYQHLYNRYDRVVAELERNKSHCNELAKVSGKQTDMLVEKNATIANLESLLSQNKNSLSENLGKLIELQKTNNKLIDDYNQLARHHNAINEKHANLIIELRKLLGDFADPVHALSKLRIDYLHAKEQIENSHQVMVMVDGAEVFQVLMNIDIPTKPGDQHYNPVERKWKITDHERTNRSELYRRPFDKEKHQLITQAEPVIVAIGYTNDSEIDDIKNHGRYMKIYPSTTDGEDNYQTFVKVIKG